MDTSGKFRVLYQFTGGADGNYPDSGVVRDSRKLLRDDLGRRTGKVGVVYMVDTGGNETVLHSFSGTDGADPYPGVIRDPAGNLYGESCSRCRTGYSGVVYKIDASGHETVLDAFADWKDGWGPLAGLIGDPEGNLDGITDQGGPGGEETVFKLDSAGQETLLYSFTGGTDGAQPWANVNPRFRGQAAPAHGHRRRRETPEWLPGGRDRS